MDHPSPRCEAWPTSDRVAISSHEAWDHQGGVKSLERELHQKFAHLWKHGEWFRINEELSEYIDRNASEWNARGTPTDVPSEAEGETYGDTVNALSIEFLTLHARDWSPFSGSPFPAAKFFEFCRERGVKLRRSDRTYLKATKRGLALTCYEYKN